MTTTAYVFLGLAAAFAVLDWVAVARKVKPLEYVSKPLATGSFLVVAASLDVAHDGQWAWHLTALAFCIAGDVFLMLPKKAFVQGLASFAIAQILFTVGFLSADISGMRLLGAAVVAVPVAVFLARRFVGAMKGIGQNELVVPVIVYVTVISAMAVSAVGNGSVVAILGAILFMLSDSLIAESRFVKARFWHPVGIMVTYHLALAGLVLGLL